MSNEVTITGASPGSNPNHAAQGVDNITTRSGQQVNIATVGGVSTGAERVQVVSSHQSATGKTIHTLADGMQVSDEQLQSLAPDNAAQSTTNRPAQQESGGNPDDLPSSPNDYVDSDYDLSNYGEVLNEVGDHLNAAGISDSAILDAIVPTVVHQDADHPVAVALAEAVGEEQALQFQQMAGDYLLSLYVKTAADMGLSDEQTNAALQDVMHQEAIIKAGATGNTGPLKQFLTRYK